MSRPDLRAPMAAGIAIRARISAMSTGTPADLSGMPAKTVHRALAWTSTPGIGTGEIDVTNKSPPMGSVLPMSTALPVNSLAGIAARHHV